MGFKFYFDGTGDYLIANAVEKNSVSFDGNGDYLTIPASSNLNIIDSDFTIECWIYRNGGTSGYIVNQDDGGSSFQNFQFSISSSGVPQITTFSTSSRTSFWVLISNNSVSLNTWTHLAVTKSGSTTRLFVNGILSGTSTNSYWSGTSLPTTINNWNSGSTPNNQTDANASFNGFLSNIRILKGTALYTTNFTPPITPLTAIPNTVLLICKNNIFKDESINNFTVTKVGNAAISTDSPFTAANPGSFGTNDFTIEALYRPKVKGSGAHLINNYNTWNSNSLALVVESDLKCKVAVTSTSYPVITSATALDPTKYNHIALTRSGSTFDLFINGRAEGSHINAAPNLSHSSGNLWIGTNGSSLAESLLGWLDGFRVIKNESLYKNEITVPTAQLPNTAIDDVHYASTPMLLHGNGTNGSTNIVNSGSTNLNFSRIGNTSISTAQVKFGDGSIYFDGSGDYLEVFEAAGPDGPELITNGDFSNGSTGWTIAQSSVVGGKLSVSGGFTFAQQENVVEPGKIYTISFDMTTTSFNGGSVRLLTSNGGAILAIWPQQNGTVTATFTSTGTYISLQAHDNVFSGTIDNVSVKLAGVLPTFSNISSSACTIEAWVYPVNLNAWQYNSSIPMMIGNMSATETTNNWSFGPMADGKVRFYYYNGSQQGFSSMHTIAANQWSHIAFTKTADGRMNIWVNGKGTAAAIIGTISTDRAGFTIGKYYNAGGINGYIDDLRVTYGVVRYTSDFTPPTSLGLTANTTLLTCNAAAVDANNKAIDQSSLNYTITSVGDVGLAADGINATSNLIPSLYSTSLGPTPVGTPLKGVVIENFSEWTETSGTGKIYGTLKQKIGGVDVAVSRKLFLYSEITKQAIAETVSDSLGNYEFNKLNINQKYYILSFDPQKNKNAVIADNISPESM